MGALRFDGAAVLVCAAVHVLTGLIEALQFKIKKPIIIISWQESDPTKSR
jgi:hypothetical protein